MARHKRIYRADTSAMQGEGSWVEFTSPKVGDIRAVQSAKVTEDYELALNILRDNIVDWNWIDEESLPLSLPKDNIEELRMDEIAYLVRVLVTAREQDLKN